MKSFSKRERRKILLFFRREYFPFTVIYVNAILFRDNRSQYWETPSFHRSQMCRSSPCETRMVETKGFYILVGRANDTTLSFRLSLPDKLSSLGDLNDSVNFRRVRRRVRATMWKLGASPRTKAPFREAGWNYVHRITKRRKRGPCRVASQRFDRRAANAVTEENPPQALACSPGMSDFAGLLSFISKSAI